jgi:hypothetical protein
MQKNGNKNTDFRNNKLFPYQEAKKANDHLLRSVKNSI